MKAHRRVLPITEPRCLPFPDCHRKNNCARFVCGIPQGKSAPVQNFSTSHMSGITCSNFLTAMVIDGVEPEEEKVVKPWPIRLER